MRLFFLALGLVLTGPILAQAEDRTECRIVEQRQGNTINLRAESDRCLDFTVTLQATLQNATASAPMPLTVDSEGQKSVALLTLRQRDATKPWKYAYTYHYRPGGRGPRPAEDVAYLLPFPATNHFRILQGYRGSFSHAAGSADEHAIDWGMPEGSPVCAARAGTVVGVRQNFSGGGTSPRFKPLANYVLIRHADGTFAEYYHLEKNGVLVKLGETVAAGQVIGRSGNTGYSSGPHLHFAVFQNLDASNRVTYPVRFQTAEGAPVELDMK